MTEPQPPEMRDESPLTTPPSSPTPVDPGTPMTSNASSASSYSPHHSSPSTPPTSMTRGRQVILPTPVTTPSSPAASTTGPKDYAGFELIPTRRSIRLEFQKSKTPPRQRSSSPGTIDWRDIPLPAPMPKRRKKRRQPDISIVAANGSKQEEKGGSHTFSRLAALVSEENVRNAEEVTRLRLENEQLRRLIREQALPLGGDREAIKEGNIGVKIQSEGDEASESSDIQLHGFETAVKNEPVIE